MPMGRKRTRQKLFNILFFIVNTGRTMIAFPSVPAVKVTREISNRKNFNCQIFSELTKFKKKIINRLE